MPRISFDVDIETHRHLKQIALDAGISLKGLLLGSLGPVVGSSAVETDGWPAAASVHGDGAARIHEKHNPLPPAFVSEEKAKVVVEDAVCVERGCMRGPATLRRLGAGHKVSQHEKGGF